MFKYILCVGQGKLHLGDGGFYEGTFVRGEIEGHGYRVFGISGKSYSGQFRKGEMNGQGLMRWTDGSQYEGNFTDNVMEGWCTLIGDPFCN